MLAVAEGQSVVVRMVLRKGERGFEVRVLGEVAGDEREYCHGSIGAATGGVKLPARKELSALTAGLAEVPLPATFGDGTDGLRLGPHWRCLRRLWRGDGEGVAELELAPALVPEAMAELAVHPLHPALLDGALGFVGLWLPAAYVPCGYEAVRLFGPLTRQLCSHVYYALPDGAAPDTLELDVTIRDLSGTPLVEVSGLALRRLHVRAR